MFGLSSFPPFPQNVAGKNKKMSETTTNLVLKYIPYITNHNGVGKNPTKKYIGLSTLPRKMKL